MGAAATTTTPAGTPAATPKKCKDGLAENERQVPWKESNLEPLPLVEEAFGSVKVTDDELESMKPKEKAQMITNILSSLCRRRVADMSPNLGRHCVSLRHRRGPDIPNLYQLLPTSTNQPKHTGTFAIIEFLCLSSNNDHEITNMLGIPDMSSNVMSFWTPCRHDIFLCLQHDQRVADTECRRLGNKNDTPTSDIRS